MILFLDFEASGLFDTSFPIEVAWVHEDGRSERYLIRPHPSWLADGCPGWSSESEAIHGISMATLLAEGEPVELVAARAAEALVSKDTTMHSDAPEQDDKWLYRMLTGSGGKELAAARSAEALASKDTTVYSDAPEQDGEWLHRLLTVGGRTERVDVRDVREAYAIACVPLIWPDMPAAAVKAMVNSTLEWTLSTGVVAWAEENEVRINRARHRALPDAEALWRIWSAIQAKIAEIVKERRRRGG